MTQPDVAIGQIWKDNDPDTGKRELEIIEIRDNTVFFQNTETGRKGKAQKGRFDGRTYGYSYLRGGPSESARS